MNKHELFTIFRARRASSHTLLPASGGAVPLDSVVLQPGPAVRSRWIQQDWPELAACRGLLDLFFPPAGEREPSRLVREAKARLICAECPVMAECRDYARHNRELGFWGGENDEERIIARRKARAIAARQIA